MSQKNRQERRKVKVGRMNLNRCKAELARLAAGGHQLSTHYCYILRRKEMLEATKGTKAV